MDPLLMVGGWAAAIVAAVAAGRILVAAFVKAVRVTVNDEFRKVWTELNDQDQWFHEGLNEVKTAIAEVREQFLPNHGSSLRDAVDRLEQMLREHVERD